MRDFSRPLADAVRNARVKMNLTQEKVAELVDTNTKTISSIENKRSNTRMETLYPLIRLLRIDANEIFYSEMIKDSSAKHQLRVLIDDCTDEEAAALLTTSETILKVLREKRPLSVKEKSLSPL